jgi:hypothetical protein
MLSKASGTGTHGSDPAADLDTAHRRDVDDHPLADRAAAAEWPPHRIDTGSPARRANPIAAEASAGVRHLTMPAGLTSWNRAIAGLRTTS